MTLRVSHLADGRKAIIIRTSDRIGFKKCRRSWSWSSHLAGNLGPRHLASPLWFGSAIHYALEDFHGYRHFDTAADAFRAYCIATSKQHARELPDDAHELFKLGTAMMDYYADGWLRTRKADETFWDACPDTGELIPQVEVNFEIPIPLDQFPHLAELAALHGADCVLYRGTIDRVAIDEFGRLWVVEYKTAKRAEHLHYQTDPQVTTYVWAAQQIYPGYEVAGVVYQQFIKNEPAAPRILSSGLYSTASNLMTSVNLYQPALESMYGSVALAPKKNRDFLVELMQKEDEDNDKFITRAYIERTNRVCEAEAQKILLELEDILNPDLAMYPNPTRECSRMCSFFAACTAFDDGSDWEGILEAKFASRDLPADRLWRERIPDPGVLAEIRRQKATPNLFDAQIRIQNMSEEARDAVERGEAQINFTFNT